MFADCGCGLTAGLPSFSTVDVVRAGVGGLVGVQAVAGGLCPMVLVHSRSHALDHGQCVGNRSTGRL